MIGQDQNENHKERKKKTQTQQCTQKSAIATKQLTLLPVDPNKPPPPPTQSIKDPTLRETRLANQKKYNPAQML